MSGSATRKPSRRSIVPETRAETGHLKLTTADPPVRRAKKREPTDNRCGSEPEGFSIVGIGASAGGLEALEEFFRHMPADSGQPGL